MNTFVNTIGNEMTTTLNGMDAYKSTLDANVDLFFKIGASRGQNVLPLFTKALAENRELALRIAQWARDVRGGAGERQIYRDILNHLEKVDVKAAALLAVKTPEIGRWDDLLVFKDSAVRKLAFEMIGKALFEDGNGLAAKWMPRKGPMAIALRNYFGLTPKQYRKFLVSLTDVVETKMCAKNWEAIDFGKLPSLAAARYKTAFYRNAEPLYRAYAERLAKGTDKINAGAVYPYDVVRTIMTANATETAVALAQWEALPNYVGDHNILPIIDVSGSMSQTIGENHNLNALTVAVSLGLYVADKMTGAFKDATVTFSSEPKLEVLRGDIVRKYHQLSCQNWGMSTNLEKAMGCILGHAIRNQVPAQDMPSHLLIISDMQFNKCMEGTALSMITKKFEAAGYKVPAIIFWNIVAYDNVPARFDSKGVGLISGFSPAIMKAVLATDMDAMTPKAIMLKTVLDSRYDLIGEAA